MSKELKKREKERNIILSGIAALVVVGPGIVKSLCGKSKNQKNSEASNSNKTAGKTFV